RNINYDSRLSVYFKPIGNTITVTKKYNGINKIDSIVTQIYPDSIEYYDNILQGAAFFRKNSIQAIDSNKIYFTGMNKDTSIKIGTVLTDSNSSIAPGGLFRKIVSFDTVSGKLVANTVPALITDVVKNGRITGNGFFTPDSLYAIDSNIISNQTFNINGEDYKVKKYVVNGILDYSYVKDGKTYIRVPFSFDCEKVLPDLCKYAGFRFDGYVLIDASYNFSIDIDFGRIKKIELIYSANTEYELNLDANLSLHGEIPLPPLATISVTPNVLSIGVKVPEYLPQIQLKLGLKAGINGEVSMHRKAVSAVSKKITYKHEPFFSLPTFEIVDLQPPYNKVISDEFHAEVEAEITPYLSLRFICNPFSEIDSNDVKNGFGKKEVKQDFVNLEMEAGIELPWVNKLTYDFKDLYYSSKVCLKGDALFKFGLFNGFLFKINV
ncbi:MAG: hypothetical protein ORN58_03550, partial [Sediminibacterium sp.]|nr:hypothetical protein [Sediminibacterium sp.]